MTMQWNLSHGGDTIVRAALDSEARVRGGRLATGESTPDDAYVSASLLLAVGDTATAIRTLDAPLDSLEALHTWVFQYLPLAGCLMRMMVLRADLAMARGESLAARHWASAVVTLWSGAEPAFKPVVMDMKRILESAR